MNNFLQTKEACEFFSIIANDARCVLSSLNSMSFDDCQEKVNRIKDKIQNRQINIRPEDAILNDFFVLLRFADFLFSYSQFWRKLLNKEFSSSWNSLQDSLDLLRLIKRFSAINIVFFENQLLELEKAYPYNIFLSIGATFEYFKCSLCGLDIDSIECPHMQGELYGGKMAQAIAQNMIEASHISLVPVPKDKRCVVAYEDTVEQFKLVRELANLINTEKFKIFDFVELQFSTKFILNPNYVKLGRNEPCYCQSGKKFKKCCILKRFIEDKHVDFMVYPNSIDVVIP